MDEVTLAELAMIGVFVYFVYRLLTPLTRRLERAILRMLDPERARIIDVTPEPPGAQAAGRTKSRKRED